VNVIPKGEWYDFLDHDVSNRTGKKMGAAVSINYHFLIKASYKIPKYPIQAICSGERKFDRIVVKVINRRRGRSFKVYEDCKQWFDYKREDMP